MAVLAVPAARVVRLASVAARHLPGPLAMAVMRVMVVLPAMVRPVVTASLRWRREPPVPRAAMAAPVAPVVPVVTPVWPVG